MRLLIHSLLFASVALVACRAPDDPLLSPDMAGLHPKMKWTAGASLVDARAGMPLVLDTAGQRLIGFGGVPLSTGGPFSAGLTDDAWSTLMVAGTAPPGRTGHCAAWLPTQHEAAYFGGHDDKGAATPPALVWSDGAFTDVIDASYAPTDGCAAAQYAPSGKVVIFGGTLPSGASAQTWFFDGDTHAFSRDAPTQSPTARAGASLSFDAGAPGVSGAAQLVLFGGNDGSGELSDVWLFNGTTWGEIGTLEDPSTPDTDEPRPLARSKAAVAIDPNRRLLYVYGGQRLGQALDDLWRLDLRSFGWQRLTVDAGPVGRYDASVAYDPSGDRLLVFGGMGSTGPLSDGWILSPAP